jgi:ribosomal protein S19E (S16A)
LTSLEEAGIIGRVAPQDKEDVKLLPRKISPTGQKSLNEIAKQVFNSLLAN